MCSAFSVQIFNLFSISIRAKFCELKIFLETLQKIGFSFSAICVQESWLSDSEDTYQLQLKRL